MARNSTSAFLTTGSISTKTLAPFFANEVSFSMNLSQIHKLLGELEKLKKERELHLSREKRIEEALISAQRSAELINESSQERAKLIVKEAEIKAKEVVKKDEEKLKRLDDEIEKLERQKRLFIAKLKSLIETHSELLNFYEEKPEEEKVEKPIKKKVVKKNTSQTGILFEG